MEVDLYQRELRLQEDEIYRLEDYIEEYQALVRGYRCEIEELEQKLADDRPASPTPASPAPITRPTNDPPQEPAPAFERPEPGFMPEIEMPDPAPEAAPSLPAPGGSDLPPPFKPGSASHAPRAFPIQTASAATPIESAAHEPPARVTGVDRGFRVSASEEESGVLLATVTAVTRESLAGFAGEASIMLTDPSIDGAGRRIARWDYSVAEVADAWVGQPGDRTLGTAGRGSGRHAAGSPPPAVGAADRWRRRKAPPSDRGPVGPVAPPACCVETKREAAATDHRDLPWVDASYNKRPNQRRRATQASAPKIAVIAVAGSGIRLTVIRATGVVEPGARPAPIVPTGVPVPSKFARPAWS